MKETVSGSCFSEHSVMPKSQKRIRAHNVLSLNVLLWLAQSFALLLQLYAVSKNGYFYNCDIFGTNTATSFNFGTLKTCYLTNNLALYYRWHHFDGKFQMKNDNKFMFYHKTSRRDLRSL